MTEAIIGTDDDMLKLVFYPAIATRTIAQWGLRVRENNFEVVLKDVTGQRGGDA